MYGLGRSLGRLGAPRMSLLSPTTSATATKAAPRVLAARLTISSGLLTRPLTRSFSILGTQASLSVQHRFQAVAAPPTTQAVQIKMNTTNATAAAGQPDTMLGAQGVGADLSDTAGEVVDSFRKDGLVFEIGLSFVVTHYISIFIGLMRCLFQSFRPLLILFVFGNIFKAVFFITGAPIWMSFYSIWLFEVGYGLAQCVISFIFISFFYNNLAMARVRPSVVQFLRQQHEKLRRISRVLC